MSGIGTYKECLEAGVPTGEQERDVRKPIDRQGLMVFVVGLCTVLGGSSGVWAQPAPSAEQLLEDFNHYVAVANIEMAEANARALLDMGMDPLEFLGVVEDSATLEKRFDMAYRRALVNPDLEALAAELYGLYIDGQLDRARDPAMIAENILLLTGGRRQAVFARDRLSHAGEYAVPQLLEALVAARDPELEIEVQSLLVDMGPDAVVPLSVALGHIEASSQEVVARVLGRIPYTTSLPYLQELVRTTGSASVHEAASMAIRNVGGAAFEGGPVGSMYRELGEQYYSEARSLTRFAGERHQLVWHYDDGLGLLATAVVSEVYHEARAMELAEHALRLDAQDAEAVSLWLAANFSRELDQAEGYENPLYPSLRRGATYYAVASGARAVQRVLGRALRDRDTRLARRAIDALARMSGESGLSGSLGERSALVAALSYPDRRVQYEAALSLGGADPTTGFSGAERVVPLLASAIRDASKRYAAVVARDVERQQDIRAALEGAGYTVLTPASGLSQLIGLSAESAGLDLIVSDMTGGSTEELIGEVRRSSRMRATPVVAVVSTAAIAQYSGRFDDDAHTRLVRTGVSLDQLMSAVGQLMERSSGKQIGDSEGEEYALASLATLRDLAIGGSSVFDVADATVPLLAALGETDGEVMLRVADVLSFVPQRRAQVALMDGAMDTGGSDRIEILGRVTDSAKRFGNLLEERQIGSLLEIAREGSNAEATAAAALLGALDLSSGEIVRLILDES